jgi:hypothetical protein
MPTYTIVHPQADEISVQNSEYHMCRKGISSEIAFFLNGKWVCDPIEPFADYHDGSIGGTSVYGYVPDELIDAFMAENGAVQKRWDITVIGYGRSPW